MQVHLFDQTDERTLDAICERLKPALCTEGTFLVREGDPVNEMLFIIRGHLDSYTTNGGRTGFFNSSRIGPGDFCGEELLTWALDPNPSIILPSSTRSVKALSEVEAFALRADDLKFVASQFRRLHSKQLRHKFRFYSHHWRTWAACFIQAAWRRFKRRKEITELRARESSIVFSEVRTLSSKSGWGAYDTEIGSSSGSGSSIVIALQKPAEPDFSVDVDWIVNWTWFGSIRNSHNIVCIDSFFLPILCFFGSMRSEFDVRFFIQSGSWNPECRLRTLAL